jgi:hypothetical protein
VFERAAGQPHAAPLKAQVATKEAEHSAARAEAEALGVVWLDQRGKGSSASLNAAGCYKPVSSLTSEGKPRLSATQCDDLLRHGLYGMAADRILTSIPTQNVFIDALHLVLNVVHAAIGYLIHAFHMCLTVEGKLRTDDEIRAYKPPSGKEANRPAAWAKSGFWVPLLFPQMAGHPDLKGRRFAKSYPIQGWEANQCYDAVAYFPIWYSYVLTKCDLRKGLRDHAGSSLAAPMLDTFKVQLPAWWEHMHPVLKQVCSVAPDMEVLTQELKSLRSTMRKVCIHKHKVVPKSYEHFLWCHVRAQIRRHGNLIKGSCWVTEHMNAVWHALLARHTSYGGGRPGQSGCAHHPNAQVLKRLSLVYAVDLLGLNNAIADVSGLAILQQINW